jgi:FKBP-type peptidyl-prolyl cis-trans isomerase
MRLRIFTLLLVAGFGFSSCRKDKIEQDIKQYDQTQIEQYISANGLTGVKRDTSDGDTTGIYYQIISQGTGKQIDYSDNISMVYTIKTFDGKFVAADTFANHAQNYVGHLAPNGLVLALKNVVKYKGTRARVLIPSRLAYGRNGTGSGSSSNSSGRIAGNQCLDYYIDIVDDQAKYDEVSIQKYMAANNLTGYSKTADGLYYKILTQGTGSQITDYSAVTTTYTGQLFNNSYFDNGAQTTAVTFSDITGLVPGVNEGLKLLKGGSSISMLIPSALGYGNTSNGSLPINSCLRFEFQVTTVTP